MVFIAVGKEGPNMERVAGALRDKVQELHPKKEQVHFRFLEHLDHANILHLALYEAFETLFEQKKK